MKDVLSDTIIIALGSLLLLELLVHEPLETVDWDAMANREGGRSSRSIVLTTTVGSVSRHEVRSRR